MTDPRHLDLVDRLRGKYHLPVNDGAGPLNGSMTFSREFKTPPIQHEAADEIERLRLHSDVLEDCVSARVGELMPDLRAEIERLRAAVSAIQKATLEGRVCDDVAWFDTITTLHDYCAQTLEPVAVTQDKRHG